MRPQLRTLACIILILCAITLSCRDSGENRGVAVLRIGYTPIAANLPIYVGIEEGIFAKNGVKVEPIEFSNAQLHTQALFQGRVEGTATIPTASAFLANAESPGRFKMVMFNVYVKGRNTDGIVVPAQSNITSLRELGGKRIALIPDPSAEIFIGYVFRNLGIAKPQFVRLPLTDHLSSLAAGTVDGAWTLDPLITIGLTSNAIKLIDQATLATHIQDPFLVAGYTISTDLIGKQPEVALAYKKSLAQAAEYIKQYPAESRRHIAKYTKGLDPKLVSQVAITEYALAADGAKSHFVGLANFFMREGLIPRQSNPTQLLY